jgi:DNA-binding MarR family transcriptional regulator
MSKEKQPKPLSEVELVALAEFRYQIRRFLRHMEEHSRELGHNPQQYQLLLAIEGLPRDKTPTISTLAERMQLNHNSMVELADRCEERGLIRRTRSDTDRRQVELAVTSEGGSVLRKLASAARQELRTIGPVLLEAIQAIEQDAGFSRHHHEDRQRPVKSRKSSQEASEQRSKL